MDCFHIFCAYKVQKKCDQVHMQYELAVSMFKINFFFLLDKKFMSYRKWKEFSECLIDTLHLD